MSSKQRKLNEREQWLDSLIDAAEDTTTLTSWNEFVEALQLPTELFPALMTGRPELLVLMRPRALTEAECKVMYTLIGALIRTNMALRLHAEQVAHLVKTWGGAFSHLQSVGRRVENFANFKRTTVEEEDEENAA